MTTVADLFSTKIIIILIKFEIKNLLNCHIYPWHMKTSTTCLKMWSWGCNLLKSLIWVHKIEPVTLKVGHSLVFWGAFYHSVSLSNMEPFFPKAGWGKLGNWSMLKVPWPFFSRWSFLFLLILFDIIIDLGEWSSLLLLFPGKYINIF